MYLHLAAYAFVVPYIIESCSSEIQVCVLRVQKMDCIDPHLSLELRLLLSGVLWFSEIDSQCDVILVISLHFENC